MDAKKKVERRYLDVARRGIDDFPPGEVTATESPDFLIETSGRIVGVEVTRIFIASTPHSPPPQSQDTERDVIAERAQAIATDHSLDPVMVDVYFDSRVSVGKGDREPIAKQLVELVAENMPALGDDRSIERRYRSNPQLPAQVEAVHIWRFKPLTSHLWQSADGGIVHTDFAPHLQQLISDKDEKISAYRARCGECWLVIVADWRGPSAFFEVSEKMKCHDFTTAFDRVYFVEGHSDRVVALKTSPKAG